MTPTEQLEAIDDSSVPSQPEAAVTDIEVAEIEVAVTSAKQGSEWFKGEATSRVESLGELSAPQETFANHSAGEIFEMVDKDGSGTINREEFEHLHKMGAPILSPCSYPSVRQPVRPSPHALQCPITHT